MRGRRRTREELDALEDRIVIAFAWIAVAVAGTVALWDLATTYNWFTP